MSVINIEDPTNTNTYHEHDSTFALHVLLNAESFADGLSQQDQNDQ